MIMRELIDIIAKQLSEDVVQFPKKKIKYESPNDELEKEYILPNFEIGKNDNSAKEKIDRTGMEKLTVEILFSGNGHVGAAFDSWLHNEYEVDGSGYGPEGRDVWIVITKNELTFAKQKIQKKAKKFGLPPVKIRIIG